MGLGNVFIAFPIIHTVLKYFGIAYLLYLSWKIALFNDIGSINKETHKPFSFQQAMLFQWVNPKVWMASIGAIATFTGNHNNIFWEVFVIAVVFCLVSIPCISLWVLIGVNMKRFLKKTIHLKIFNYSMASLLIASIVLSFFL